MTTRFALFCFALRRDAQGCPTQDVRRCGEFQCIERAFDAAKTEAVRSWQEAVAALRPADRKVDIRIVDTEWGYELRRDRLVICRCWVHDTAPTAIAGVTA